MQKARPQLRPGWHLSPHYTQRCQQRGLRRDARRLIEAYGEISRYQKNGRVLLSMRATDCADLVKNGVCPQTVEQAARKALVIAEDGTLITCLNVRPNLQKGRAKSRRSAAYGR